MPPFAPNGASLGCMKDEAFSKLATAVRTQPPLRRSALYRWLLSRHRKVSKLLARENPSWIVVADMVAAAGVLNTRGHPATPDSVRRVWACVLKDVEARTRQKSAKRVNPSRLPANWKPTPADPPQPAAAPRYAPPNTVPARTAPIELSEEARATLAALDRQLDHRDRFVNPPKRKD